MIFLMVGNNIGMAQGFEDLELRMKLFAFLD